MKISILTTGGTIDKDYDELDGSLKNDKTILDQILKTLRIPDLFIKHVKVMNIDSTEMIESDRETILRYVENTIPASKGIIVLHGTDTLDKTGEYLHEHIDNPPIPIILTGAMRPFIFRDSDAIQNIVESLFAVRLLDPGVYAVMHNKVLSFPGVYKDRNLLSFTKK